MRRTRPVMFALLLLLPPVTVAAAPGAHLVVDDDRYGLRVTDDHLEVGFVAEPQKQARATLRALTGSVEAGPRLDLLMTFGQPVVRGEHEIVGALALVATGGEWRGVYWAEADDGTSVGPSPVTVGPEGRLFVLSGGANATGATLRASYTFLGPNGTAWTLELPEAPVVDATPVTGRAVVAGAALAKRHEGLPRMMLVSVWNQAGADAPMGFAVFDGKGRVAAEHIAGGCRLETLENRASEAGCRALFLVEREGREIATWHETPDGARVEGERLAVRAFVETPYVRGVHAG